MVKVKTIFFGMYFLLLWSRIYVIAGMYHLPIDSSLIQVCYVGAILLIEMLSKKNKISKKIGGMEVAILLLIVYWILFSFVFVNPVMARYTKGVTLRQGLFLAVAIATALFVKKHRIIGEWINISFLTIALVLVVQFAMNISELAYINVGAIFNVSIRSRVNFGLGHYNYLGMLCASEIVLGIWLIKSCEGIKRYFVYGICALAVIMLLGSASRNAIFSLIVFALVEAYLNLNNHPLRKLYKLLIKILIVVTILVMILWNNGTLTVENLLLDSNRMTLFSAALPTFMNSGRTWIGLGLASGEIYGENLTPYKTYWLDNGYIYTLVTSGYLGAIIYIVVIVLFLWKFVKLRKKNEPIGNFLLGTFWMYLFGALFETTLFNGGVLHNYFWVPIFLIGTSDYFERDGRDKFETRK